MSARRQRAVIATVDAYLDAEAEEVAALFMKTGALLLDPDAADELRWRASLTPLDGDGARRVAIYQDLAARLDHLRLLLDGHTKGRTLVVPLVRLEMGDLPEDPAEEIALLTAMLARIHGRRTALVRAALCLELGHAYTRHNGDNRHAALLRAIDCFDTALTAFEHGASPRDFASTLRAKADALAELADLLDGPARPETLRRSVDCYRATLAVATPDGGTIAYDDTTTRMNMATVLVELVEVGHGVERTERAGEALSIYDKLLQRSDLAGWHSLRAALHLNRGNALQALAKVSAPGPAIAALKDAALAYRDALAIYRPEADPLDWALAQNNRGNALTQLAELQSGEHRAATLREALACYEQAQKATPRSMAPLQWGSIQNNRGNGLIDLAWALPDALRAETLRSAIACYDDALQVRRRDLVPHEWATSQNNKGIALSDLAARLEGPEARNTLYAALACFDAALEIRRRDVSPGVWAATQENRASALAQLASLIVESDREVLLRRAISAYEEALAEYPDEAGWHARAEVESNEAVVLCDLADLLEGPQRRQVLDQAAARFDKVLATFTQDESPLDHRRAAQRAGLAFFRGRDWPRAARYLSAAATALDDLYALAVTAHGHEAELLAGGDLCAHLAYALARAGGPSAARQAAAALERSRARATGETIARWEAAVRSMDRIAADRLEAFQHAAERLAVTTFGFERGGLADDLSLGVDTITPMRGDVWGHAALNAQLAGLEEARAARRAYEAALANIRVIEPAFMRDDDEEAPSIAPHMKLVVGERICYVATTSAGAVAITLEPAKKRGSSAADIALYDEVLTTTVVERLLGIGTYARDDQGRPSGLLAAQRRRGRLDVALEQVLVVLSAQDAIFVRLARAWASEQVSRVVCVSCGLLGFLPLHAIPVGRDNDTPGDTGSDEETTLADVARLSFAPSARIWRTSRERARRRGEPLRALVVGNPLPQPGIPLPGASQEARDVSALINGLPGAEAHELLERQATLTNTLDLLRQLRETATHLHFACHAVSDLENPAASGVVLAEGQRLRLADLLRPESGLTFPVMRLVVLSACQTGQVGTRLPDEVVGLPAGWLQAGAAGVLVSLWPVSDRATLALMLKFYQLYAQEGIDPVDALWLAQRWMRGVASWRDDCLAAGARRGAEGAEVEEILRMLDALDVPGAQEEAAPRSTAFFEEPDEGEQSDGDSAAARGGGQTLHGGSWRSARHWAAFALYGA